MVGALRRSPAALALVAAIAGALAAPAGAADVPSSFEVEFTTRAPGAPTGLRIVLEYLPDDPNAKPPPVEGGQFVLPAGTVVDDGALPQCAASDAEVYALGRAACRPETQLGVGRLVAITGFGSPFDPFDAESHTYNAPGHVLAMIVPRGTDRVAGFDRLTIDGSTLTAHPPPVPGGPPDGRTSVKRIEMNVPVPAAGARPYVTTPPACPVDGLWRARGDFHFAGGHSSSTPVAVPCEPGGEAGREPGIALRVAPAAVRAGRRSTFRVRVTSADPACERGVAVTLGRARATTGSRGRAVLRKHLSRPGGVTVRASKPGCGKARAKVAVRPAR